MTSSPEPITSRPWPYWMPILLFAILWTVGSLLGLSDDEAYHWVLGHHLALGYAYHPPGMGWFVGFSQFLFDRFGVWGKSFPQLVVRFPSSLSTAAITCLGLLWIRDAGVRSSRLGMGYLAILSLSGLSALGWMMVPDTPLLLGFALLFYCAWKYCAGSASRTHQAGIVLGACLGILGKFSGIFAASSAALCILLWAKRSDKLKGLVLVGVGSLIAVAPIIIWNREHEWTSILYQIRDRHEGSAISWVRYARFWGVELIIAGPAILWTTFRALWKSSVGLFRTLTPEHYAGIWILPGFIVYCLQPLYSDFKPHWALAVWLPAAFLMGQGWARQPLSRLARVQIVFSALTVGGVTLSFFYPIGSSIAKNDPRLDVTNDLYGWSELPALIQSLGPEASSLPRTASRYQTAAQTAAALGDSQNTSLMPKEVRSFDEWPHLDIGNTEGPDWPILKKSVLYIRDNRYDAPAEYGNSKCVSLGRVEKFRFGHFAKWIEVDRCDPIHPIR